MAIDQWGNIEIKLERQLWQPAIYAIMAEVFAVDQYDLELEAEVEDTYILYTAQPEEDILFAVSTNADLTSDLTIEFCGDDPSSFDSKALESKLARAVA